MIWGHCERGCAEKNQYTCKGELRALELQVHSGAGDLIVKCGNCDHEQKLTQAEWDAYAKEMDLKAARCGSSRAGLTKYPRVEPHTGVVVNSRDDEVRAMKAMGMHAAPNGIDERFDDESCDALRSKRAAIQKRKLEIDRKRKALGRPRQAPKSGKSAAHR